DRPNAKFGFYWTQNQNSPSNFLNPTADLLAQETEGHAIWSTVDVIFPRHYVTYKEGSTTDITNGIVTRADLKKMSEGIATLSLKCQANGNYHAQVYPFISRTVWNGHQPPSFNGVVAPTEWIYWHTYYFTQTVYNGRKANGVHVWDGSSAPA